MNCTHNRHAFSHIEPMLPFLHIITKIFSQMNHTLQFLYTENSQGKKNTHKMDTCYSPFAPRKTTSLIRPLPFFTFLLLNLSLTVAQQAMPSTPNNPTMAQCGPRLLSMAPCAPFVEGRAPGPNLQCCDSLKKVYNEQRDCLCLFLNGTALASLPINSTLALKLPGLCSPQIDPSTCSASSSSGNNNLHNTGKYKVWDSEVYVNMGLISILGHRSFLSEMCLA